MVPKLRVAVFAGGLSAEREVSLATGRQVLAALDPTRFEAFAFDPACLRRGAAVASPSAGGPRPGGLVGEDILRNAPHSLSALMERRPDVALLCLHGRYGEDGAIQGLLELIGLPYTGSGVLASALAIDKVRTKEVFRRCGIPTPPAEVATGMADLERLLTLAADPAAGLLPAIVKPSREGSTIGATMVERAGELPAALETALRFDAEVLIERFVSGVELTGAVLGDEEPEPLPLIEIVPKTGFYDYYSKYEPGATEEIVPARISPEATARGQQLACRAHRALGCRGFSRTDFILAEDGFWVLEVNTIPGMTPTSLLPRAAAAAGISFPCLLERMLALALKDRLPHE